MRPALARELENVAKPRGRDHAGARALALEHGIGAQRCPQDQEFDLVTRQLCEI